MPAQARERSVKYMDGTPVKVGDVVGLGEDRNGVVVCSMDDDVYTEAYSKEQWDYLGGGVMIEFPKWGLIHYEAPEPDLELISRATEL
jgi:hypothetical protein